ncbi:MAG: DUF3135 domain-containing protein [Thiobacillaceae bacterium]|jgi:hypothetical protein|nr:DUF3135 domain-containing protein [Thiobacillaceae bacterium]
MHGTALSPPPSPPFDFDEWANLARNDAAAFELRRREVVEQFIAQAPAHQRERLRRLQWRIDAERRRYKHPLKSCLAIYDMMWDSLYGGHGLLEALLALRDLKPVDDWREAAPPDNVRPLRR